MSTVVDMLEKRVVAAAELIADLRSKVARLEQELVTSLARTREEPAQPTPPSQDPSLAEELERLRAERILIREGIRALIAEIDQVSW